MPRKKGPGRPKGSKNKRHRRVRTQGYTVSPANGAASGDMNGDPILAGFATQKNLLQAKMDKLVAAEKSYIESQGGNVGVGAISIPAELLLTKAGTIDQRSDRAKAFLAQHPEMKGVVVQH